MLKSLKILSNFLTSPPQTMKIPYNFPAAPVVAVIASLRLSGCRKDEHSLISVYCKKLQEGQLNQTIPDSPMQVALEIDAEQRKELELMIK